MFKYDREDLIKQLAHHEGVVLKVYKDSLGIDTIGIGRNLAQQKKCKIHFGQGK